MVAGSNPAGPTNNDPGIWDAKPDDERLQSFDPRAVEMLFDFLSKPKQPKVTFAEEQEAALKAVMKELPSIKRHVVTAGAAFRLTMVSNELKEAREKQAAAERKAARLGGLLHASLHTRALFRFS